MQIEISQLTMLIQHKRNLVAVLRLKPIFPDSRRLETPVEPPVSPRIKLIDRHIADKRIAGITVPLQNPIDIRLTVSQLTRLTGDNHSRLTSAPLLPNHDSRKQKNPQNEGAD